MKILNFFVAFLLGLSAHAFWGESDLDVFCEGLTPNKKFNICIVKTKGSTNKDVIYHLHQAGGNQRHWIERWKETRKIWRKQGFEPPAVATVNFGPIWFLAEKNSSSYSGLFDFYVDEVMPWVEKKLGYTPQRKFLLGESVGGLNGLQYYLKRPELFERYAIICPAVTPVGPYSSKEEVENFIERSKADPNKVAWLFRGERAFFPSQPEWEAADPFTLFDYLMTPPPQLLISCGAEDSFGFFEGTELFAKKIANQAPDVVQWVPLPGDHCARPFQEVAEFFK